MRWERTCRVCKQTLPLFPQYFPVHRYEHGLPQYRNECRTCFNKTQKQYTDDCYHKNLPSIFHRFMVGVKARVIKKNMEIDITEEYLMELWEKQNGLCYYSGLPMSTVRNDMNIVSVDRVDSSRGYTKDNVVLASRWANVMKNSHSAEDFIKLCRTLVNYADAKGL